MSDMALMGINPLLLVPDRKVTLTVVPSDKNQALTAAPAIVNEIKGNAGTASAFEIKIYEKLAMKIYRESWLESKGIAYDMFKMALAIHEVAHIKYDSFNIKRSDMNTVELWVINLLEDNRIEYHLSHDNPSMATYLRVMLAALRTHLDTSFNSDPRQDLVKALITRRTVELYYLTRFGLVVDGTDAEFANFCIPLVLSATRGDGVNCRKISKAIASFIEMQANELAASLKKRSIEEVKQIAQDMKNPPKTEEDEGEEEDDEEYDEDDEYETPEDGQQSSEPGEEEDDDEHITSEDDESQEEPGESTEDEDEGPKVELPASPEDVMEEDLNGDIDVNEMGDIDSGAFRRAINEMKETEERIGEDELEEINNTMDEETQSMPSSVAQIIEQFAEPEQQGGSDSKGPGPDSLTPFGDAQLEVEEREHVFYRETVVGNLELIHRLRSTIRQLFKTTSIANTFDGDLNPMRQQQAYMNSIVGEDGRDYNRMEFGQEGLDLVILRDVSGSTSGFSEDYARALVSILTAMDDLKGVRTGAIDFSDQHTELKTMDQRVSKGKIFPRVCGGTYVRSALSHALTYKFKAEHKLIIVITDGQIFDIHKPEVEQLFKDAKAQNIQFVGYHITPRPNPKRIDNTQNDKLPMAECKLEDLPSEIVRMVSKKLKNL